MSEICYVLMWDCRVYLGPFLYVVSGPGSRKPERGLKAGQCMSSKGRKGFLLQHGEKSPDSVQHFTPLGADHQLCT